MEPQPTTVERPKQLQIADDIRIRIERGELRPGDSLPTLQEICRQWSCSMNSGRAAITLLREQGLISGGRGKAPTVRMTPRMVTRSSERHREEKLRVLLPEDERRKLGVAETDMGTSLDELRLSVSYDVVPAGEELAEQFGIGPADEVLRRAYELNDPESGRREAWSVSFIPRDLIVGNPALLDAENEPWPGGTQHQLHTVGIELARFIEDVTAQMPTTVDRQRWGLDRGVPLLRIRRAAVDVHDHVVELSNADFPADRTRLQFVTDLPRW